MCRELIISKYIFEIINNWVVVLIQELIEIFLDSMWGCIDLGVSLIEGLKYFNHVWKGGRFDHEWSRLHYTKQQSSYKGELELGKSADSSSDNWFYNCFVLTCSKEMFPTQTFAYLYVRGFVDLILEEV